MNKKIKKILNKKNKSKIVCLTAYSKNIAEILDKHCDLVLVGDSLGSVLYNFKSTKEVTLQTMINHSKSVRLGVNKSLMVFDMPYNTYRNPQEALRNAKLVIKQTKCDAVKLEGGSEIVDSIKRILTAGIPVMGHLGLTPQSIYKFGTYTVRAKEDEEAQKLIEDAKLLEEAGCFAIIAEMLDNKLADELTKQMLPPLIGIGSGDNCDGQILVTHDLLGLTPSPIPSFVKPCASLGLDGLNALQKYVHRIRGSKLKE